MTPTVKVEGIRISVIPSQYQTNDLFQLSIIGGATHSTYLESKDAMKVKQAIFKLQELMGEEDGTS